MSENGNVCIPCGIRSFSRNIYFNGKPLLERDFNAEQAYMVGKDWLHNNLLHGVGTGPAWENEAEMAENITLQLERLKRLHRKTADIIVQIERDIGRMAAAD